MSKLLFEDLFQDSSFENTNKNTASLKKQAATHESDDDWSDFVPTKKTTTTTTTIKRRDDLLDDDDLDDRRNRTIGSNVPYEPSFTGGSTMTSVFSTQVQDTTQRNVGQARPATASGPQGFDDLFGNTTTSKTTTSSIDMDRTKKAVRFDDSDLLRPSTAPAPAGLTQNRPSTSVLSSLRTGLEPNKSSDPFLNLKRTMESSNTKNWLDVTAESSDEDEVALRPTQKYEPVVTTIAKKNPIVPAQESPSVVSEPPKKTLFDKIREDDQRALTEKIILPPNASSNSNMPDFLSDNRTASDKRPSTAGPSKSISFFDQLESKQPMRSSFDTKNDPADRIFSTDQQISFGTRSHSSSDNSDVKRLEFENNQLKATIDRMKRQHETEMNMLEEDYKHQLEYMGKSCERREARLKEENEHLLRQLNDRIQQYDREKSTLLTEHQRRLDEIQRDRTTELENLRTVQRQTLDHLRREHEQTIQRLKQLKQEEVSTALDVTTHTRAFESVVEHMEQNAKNIDALRQKVEAKHTSAVTDKEFEARMKEQQLKAYEERLHMQSADFERERKNLQELISRLEVHLSEQTKLVEEERWKALQSQKRMEAMQDALNGEQRLFMEKLTRDRTEIQRSKDQLLEDQKIALAGIYESRSQLADERAKVEALQKSFQEQKHRDMLQNATIEAETRAQQKLVSEQNARLEKREQELLKREEALLLEKRSLTELKQRLDIEQSTLKNQQEEYQQKLHEIEQANTSIKRDKERLSQLYYELHALDNKNTDRLQQLQKSISTLRHQEEHMNDQYSRMTIERDNLNHMRTTMPRKNPTPTIDSGFSTLQLPATTPILPINASHQSIEESTILRTLRMNALQDQLYIQDEMSFLQNLRTGNHLATRSTSLSNLPHHSDSNLLRTYH